MRRPPWFACLALLMTTLISQPTDARTPPDSRHDIHSFSRPEQVRVSHVDLDLAVDFNRKVLAGTATLKIEKSTSGKDARLILDTRNLNVSKAEVSSGGKKFVAAKFETGPTDPILGAALNVELSDKTTHVRVTYETNPDATGLQWLEPSQTAGRKHPFMFTQSQAIHARTWIPIQDSPGVRVTYAARIRTPKNLLAVMSAENEPNPKRDGDYRFRLTHPIPPYLIALAVGDLAFKPLGKRAGVYAEPSMVGKAAWEFADTEKMIRITEKLYGPYRWGRYDILVLPPSFPFGGMENPMMTFATPTVIAGDRSLVSLISHELAHSWSGNLVTNAVWSDFWLNEGFTTYIERRIIGAIYGPERQDMEAVLGRQDLQGEFDKYDDPDEILHVDLAGRDPDDGATLVPYEKGALFLRQLEETFGRDRFDAFIRGYFDRFAFQSVTTDDFLDYLRKNLLNENPEAAAKIPLDEWIYKPGLPASAPQPKSEAFAQVGDLVERWTKGEIKAADIPAKGWATQQWLHFLRALPKDLGTAKMTELDKEFNLTKSGNSEIAFQWLLLGVWNNYGAAYPRLEQYLIDIGRRKLVKPLYEELAKTPEGLRRAQAIYRKARPGYHPITALTVDGILGRKAS